MKTLTRFLVPLLVLARLSLCAADSPVAASAPEKPKAGSYRIQPTDKLGINVGGEQELSVTGKKVDVNGNINLLYIPDLKVAGLTVREAQDAIAEAYREGRILRNPQVLPFVPWRGFLGFFNVPASELPAQGVAA